MNYFNNPTKKTLTVRQAERVSRFTHLTEAEKEEIVRRAKRLSRVSAVTLAEVSQRIARRLGLPPEIIRCTIKDFDRQHPEQALYPTVHGPLTAETKEVIFNSYRRGMSLDSLAQQFGRNRTAIARAVNEMRARRLLEQPLECIGHPSFDDPSLEAEILAPMPSAEEFENRRRTLRAPKDAPPELAALYQAPLLSKEQEQHLFRQMNFLKYQAGRLRSRLDPLRARAQDLDRLESLLEQASAIKGRIINCNMRLVVSIAKRHAGQTDNFFELLSDGNVSLIRAVEKFDFSRGNKFSTYASWAIMKNYARSIPEEKRRREHYLTGHEELFEASVDKRSNEFECLAKQEQKVRQVNRLLEHLEPREREIIRMRHGLDNNFEGMTLEEIGQQLGITKERVRQLNVRILNKLQTLAREQKLEHQ